jgi:hypothetical protein
MGEYSADTGYPDLSAVGMARKVEVRSAANFFVEFRRMGQKNGAGLFRDIFKRLVKIGALVVMGIIGPGDPKGFIMLFDTQSIIDKDLNAHVSEGVGHLDAIVISQNRDDSMA